MCHHMLEWLPFKNLLPYYTVLPMRYIIHDSRYKDIWDAWVMVLAIVVGIEMPLRLIFDFPESTLFFGLDILFTLVFSIDVILNLVPPISKEDDAPENGQRLNYNYLKSWFTIDLLAALPFGLLLSGLPLDNNQGFKILRMVRMVRLLKLARIVPLIRKWGHFYSLNPSILRMLVFLVLMVFAVHWMACGWISLAGSALTNDWYTTYIKAIYWIITTMTTVGYGDITPESNHQLIYAIFVMIIGVGTYGYVIANLANLMGNIDTARMDFVRKMSVVEAFLVYRSIPADLEQRIREYYRYIWENRLDHSEDEMIGDLPDSLQSEVTLFLRKPLLAQVPLFQEAGDLFHQEVVRYLKIHIYMPGDSIVRQGEPGDSMYFISKGSVKIQDRDDQDSLAVLGEGSFFGETSLLKEQPRNATVYATDYCNIYSLDKASFDKLLIRFPTFKKIIAATSSEREAQVAKAARPDPR